MSDNSASKDTIIVIVPPELRAQYPDIVELILQSESMNNTERQYWVDLLPVMDAEKIQELRTILTNERDQLAAIDAKYTEDTKVLSTADLEKAEAERVRKREELSGKESVEQAQAEQSAEDILKQMD